MRGPAHHHHQHGRQERDGQGNFTVQVADGALVGGHRLRDGGGQLAVDAVDGVGAPGHAFEHDLDHLAMCRTARHGGCAGQRRDDLAGVIAQHVAEFAGQQIGLRKAQPDVGQPLQELLAARFVIHVQRGQVRIGLGRHAQVADHLAAVGAGDLEIGDGELHQQHQHQRQQDQDIEAKRQRADPQDRGHRKLHRLPPIM